VRFFTSQEGDGPVLAVAVHHGHDLRREVAARLAVDEAERLREEDPYTGSWAGVAETRLVAHRSRFEVDLNRPRERAVYRTPEDAFGLTVWREPPPAALVRRSLRNYDRFYAEAARLLSKLVARYGRVVVLDLHSYNHRRAGPAAPPADAAGNPEINVGTGTLERERWAPLVDRFLRDLASDPLLGRPLDVRENVRFRGGQFSRWVNETFPDRACALALEFKKTFMDEWSGALDAEAHAALERALRAAVAGAVAELLGGRIRARRPLR